MGSLSNYYTSVQSLFSKLKAEDVHAFEQLSSDGARVTFVQGIEGIDDLFNTSPIWYKKSEEEAQRWRQRGNQSYQMNQLEDAMMSYNMSISMAPKETEGQVLALAIGNRSAVFWELGRYEDCLEDTQLAVDSGYPETLRYKLYTRRGRCLRKMGQLKRANRAFKKALEMLPLAKLDPGKTRGLSAQISDEQHGVHSDLELKQALVDSAPRVPSVKEANPRYQSASSALDINYNATRGRYAVATEDVQVGDAVAVEAPYVAVPGKEFYGSHCYHCMLPADRPVACQQCARVRYCSPKCATQSWSGYHRWECPYLDLLASSGTGSIAHLALRAVLHTGMKKIIHFEHHPKSQRTSVRHALYTDSKGVYLTGYVGVHNLMAHTTERPTNDLLQYTFLAVFLLNILKKSGFFDTASDHSLDHDEFVGGLLLHFLQIVGCNGIEITRLQSAANLLKCCPQTMGLALFPTISLFNHSCNPALEMLFYGTTCVLRALRTVPQGQELTVDYGYIYYLQSRSERQHSLHSQYFFRCACEACQGDWGLKSKLPSGIPPLKCTGCAKLLSLVTSRDPTQLRCPGCGKVQNSLVSYETLHASSRNFERAYLGALNWAVRKNLPILINHMSVMDRYVCQPWKEYATCVSIIKQAYRALANVDDKVRSTIDAAMVGLPTVDNLD